MSDDKQRPRVDESTKDEQLEDLRKSGDGEYLTTNQGVRVGHTDDPLKAGPRGPTLMEDFHFREKMTRFDHERIPERAVHARGFATKFYTDEGNFDLVGNNMPVFFIHDAIKFLDLVHTT